MYENLSEELEDSLVNAEKEGRLIDYYIEKESIFRNQGKYREIIDMSNWVENFTKATDVLLLAYDIRSSAYYFLGNYEAMFNDIEKSLEIPKDKDLLFRDGLSYMTLVDFHFRFNQMELTQFYLDKAKMIASQHNGSMKNIDDWKRLNYLIHLMQGQFYRFQKDWSRANSEYKKAEKYATDKRHISGLITQKFFLNKDKGEYGLADSVYREHLYPNNKLPFGAASRIQMEYVHLFLQTGKIETAKNELRKINPDSIPLIDKADLYALTSDIYVMENNYPLAYQYLHQAIHLKDSLDSEYQRVYAKHVSDRFEMRQMEKSLDKERLGNLRNIILIVILCSALIAAGVWVVIVISHHRKRKRDQLIAETNLGNRNAALTSAVLVADNYKNVCDDIRLILSSDFEAQQKITEIKKRLKESNNVVEPLHHISKTNDESMQEFMDKLRYVHPDLTNAELRMAQLIFMNISNKDIAEMQNRSLGTIKNQKYSLRKKIGINIPTEQYLKLLSAASPSELEELANRAKKK